MLSPQWLDELRARVTLSSVIMRTTKLQRAGREWKACCPFHNEKTPSFTVSDEKGFYHCFGCGAHGDVIRWMTDQRGLQFMDAVKELAQEAGLEVPAPDPRAAQQAEKRASLIDVTEASQRWFVEQLRGAEGARARDYLASRGFSNGVIREFGFGYAPDSKQAMGSGVGFEDAMLVESGMRIETEDGSKYDRFRDRLMLPIQDARGRVIAFGGRILDKRDGVAKYLNSPDTPLFDKGRTLYNLHRAGPASRQTGRIVVVEGYMDVIALANAGIEDAVAPLGTALTERQIEMLWRMVERPILCFDGDAAGQRAAMRAIQRALPLLRPAHSLGIVRLPAGLDPDDLINQRGAQAMEDILAKPGSLLDTLWQFERDAEPLDSPEAKAGLKARLMAHVDAIGDADIKALYRRELLDRFSDYAFPRREKAPWKPNGFSKSLASRPRPDPAAIRALQKTIQGGSRDALTGAVVAGLIRHPDQIDRHADALAEAAERDANIARAINPLLDMAEILEDGGELPISADSGRLAPPDRSHFSFLQEGTDPEDAREDLAEAVSLLVERPALETALAAATARFDTDPEGAFAEQQRLLKRKLDFEARLGQMASLQAARGQSDLGYTSQPEPAGEEKTD
ncbi:DNA primase [Erythrobacter litoralis]|uniref:DNA primase n=1 Tax=Erythrobacter litoralis (strain HTCC2594) TaxID=314225 RepID=Q2NAR5_ERYLH|nr:DNA primase [Erythrobacter litoralis]ABC63226.1 DNA primase [Erythrobacter litoralis HTCC2594]